MQINAMPAQSVWEWESGDMTYSAQFTLAAAGQSGTLTWVEDLDPFKDERGNGSHIETMQTLLDFLRNGPYNSPPVDIVEAMLAHFQEQQPAWLHPYLLLKAVCAGNLSAVQEMLAQGVPSDVPVRGATPFYAAVTSQKLAIAEALFAVGVDVNRRYAGMDTTVLTTLALYASDASWEHLAQRIMAQGADLEARNTYGETPLMVAASAGKRLPNLVGMLIAAGANVNEYSKHGYTPLRNAVSYPGAPLAVVQQLIAAGAEVNARDKEGWSVLMEAISSSLVEGVQFLLAAGADVQARSAPTLKNRAPQSVLQVALDYAHPQIIQQIRQAGGK